METTVRNNTDQSRYEVTVEDNLRNEERPVIPSCRFINSYLKRHDEYADLVPADRRAEFGL
jgi:hypothetical protein